MRGLAFAPQELQRCVVSLGLSTTICLPAFLACQASSARWLAGQRPRPHHSESYTPAGDGHGEAVPVGPSPRAGDLEPVAGPTSAGITGLAGLEARSPSWVGLVEERRDGPVQVAQHLLLGNRGLCAQPLEAAPPVGQLQVGVAVMQALALVAPQIAPATESGVPHEAVRVEHGLQGGCLAGADPKAVVLAGLGEGAIRHHHIMTAGCINLGASPRAGLYLPRLKPWASRPGPVLVKDRPHEPDHCLRSAGAFEPTKVDLHVVGSEAGNTTPANRVPKVNPAMHSRSAGRSWVTGPPSRCPAKRRWRR
jgi:hypothetical protein